MRNKNLCMHHTEKVQTLMPCLESNKGAYDSLQYTMKILLFIFYSKKTYAFEYINEDIHYQQRSRTNQNGTHMLMLQQ